MRRGGGAKGGELETAYACGVKYAVSENVAEHEMCMYWPFPGFAI